MTMTFMNASQYLYCLSLCAKFYLHEMGLHTFGVISTETILYVNDVDISRAQHHQISKDFA